MLWTKAITLGLLVATSAAMSIPAVAGAAPRHARSAAVKPTIVLVHGAWADASSFRRVTVRLQADG